MTNLAKVGIDYEATAWADGWRVAILDGRRRFIRDPKPNEIDGFDPLSGRIISSAAFPNWEELCRIEGIVQ